MDKIISVYMNALKNHLDTLPKGWDYTLKLYNTRDLCMFLFQVIVLKLFLVNLV